MEEILNITIHHSGEFVSEDLSVYEGGEIADLRVDADMWGYYELLGAIKELGYPAIEKIYYRDPTAGMNLLIDDKGALEIADLYRVHLSVEVFIQHTLSQPEYVDESEVILDETPLNVMEEDAVRQNEVSEDAVRQNEVSEDAVRHNEVSEDVVRPNEVSEDAVGQKEASEDVVMQNEASEGEVGQKEASEDVVIQNEASEGEVGQKEASEDVVMQNEASEGEVGQKEASEDVVMQNEASEGEVGQKEASEYVVIQNEASEGEVGQKEASEGEVGQKEASENVVGQNDDDSSDDDSSDDSSFKYDSAKEVVFDDETDECDTELEEEEGNDDVTDECETEANKEDCKGSDNESEDLVSECDSEDSNTTKRKKYPIFKLLKDMSNYKWEVGTYFSTKEDIKEAVTSYAVQSGRNLKYIKNDKIRVRVRCKDGCE